MQPLGQGCSPWGVSHLRVPHRMMRPPARLASAQADNSNCPERLVLWRRMLTSGESVRNYGIGTTVEAPLGFVFVNSCAQPTPFAFFALVPLRVVE